MLLHFNIRIAAMLTLREYLLTVSLKLLYLLTRLHVLLADQGKEPRDLYSNYTYWPLRYSHVSPKCWVLGGGILFSFQRNGSQWKPAIYFSNIFGERPFLQSIFLALKDCFELLLKSQEVCACLWTYLKELEFWLELVTVAALGWHSGGFTSHLFRGNSDGTSHQFYSLPLIIFQL